MVTIYEQGVAMGYAPVVTNKATGLYEVAIVASAANGFEELKEYTAAVTAIVGGVAGRDGIGSFRIVLTNIAPWLGAVAGAVTRGTLRTNARILADQDGADFPTDAQYNVYLDQARKEVWRDLVIAGYPINYSVQTVTANGSAQYTVASSASVFAVKAVRYVQGSQRLPIPRINEAQKATIMSSVGQPQASAYEVLVDPSVGTVIRFYPQAVSGSYEVEYLPDLPVFSSDSDTWYGPPGSDELLCLKAAAKGCRKEGRTQDADELMKDYRAMLDSLRTSASWVDLRNPATIRDQRLQISDPFSYFAMGPDYLP